MVELLLFGEQFPIKQETETRVQDKGIGKCLKNGLWQSHTLTEEMDVLRGLFGMFILLTAVDILASIWIEAMELSLVFSRIRCSVFCNRAMVSIFPLFMALCWP